MSQAYPVIEKYNNVELAQLRARELIKGGFVVLQGRYRSNQPEARCSLVR